jgi:sulfur-carrier protein adenylyltransferase/sulfurtransferase
LQATEAIKLILALGEPLVGRLMTYDALAMEWREFRFSRREDCAVCGANPNITSLEQAADHRVNSSYGTPELMKPRQLQSLLGQNSGRGTECLVVDVREAREFAIGHIQGTVNIPLRDIPRRLSEFSGSIPLVFLCRSGGRSHKACELALRAGFSRVFSLDGGMLAWAAGVDRDMTVAPFE